MTNQKLTPDDLRGYVNRQEEWQLFCGADFPDQWQADIDALAKAEAREQELLSIIRDLDDAVYEDLIIGRIKPSTDEADNRVYIYSEAQHEAYKEAFKDEP